MREVNFESKGALSPKTDLRDYSIAAMTTTYPDTFILSPLPEVKDQGSVGSCVAHATSEILEYFNKIETGKFKRLSTDFIYGMQGVAFNRLESGMYLRDACKIVQNYGDCLYDTINTNTEQPKCSKVLEEKLNEDIYKEAENTKVLSYARCCDDNAIKHALMNYGPVLASTKWYDKNQFENKIVRFDKNSNGSYHAIMIYGWNEDGWLCQNSWGEKWQGDGRFILPFGDVREAWSFVDAKNDDIVTTKHNFILDIFYKIINAIINFIMGRD